MQSPSPRTGPGLDKPPAGPPRAAPRSLTFHCHSSSEDLTLGNVTRFHATASFS